MPACTLGQSITGFPHSEDPENDHAGCLAWRGKGSGPHSQLRAYWREVTQEEDMETERDRLGARIENEWDSITSSTRDEDA